MTERIAGAHVDRYLGAVAQHAAQLRHVRCAADLDQHLHRSLSHLLHANVRRLEDLPRVATLTPALTAEATRYIEGAGPHVLEPLVHRRASQWFRALVELLNRLDADWEALVRRFGLSPDGRVTSISPPLGDLHQGGRAVYRVRWDDGRSLIYKPRAVSAEAAFGQMVDWLYALGLDPSLSACGVMDRGPYGWVEFVPSAPCTTEDEAERFHERQGAFLALFYLLTACDCVADNVVVHGEHPVWIDTECLCMPDLPAAATSTWAPPWMSASVLATGVVFAGNDRGVVPRRHSGLNAPCLEPRARLFDEDDILRDRFVWALIRGFRRGYDLLLEQQQVLTLNQAPLRWLRHGPVRTLPRSTAFYLPLADLLQATPARGRASLTRRIEQTLCAQHGAATWPAAFIRTELRALLRGDVPYWTAQMDSSVLVESGVRAVSGVIRRTASDVVRERVSRLSPLDRERQVWLVEAFLRMPSGLRRAS